jgi:hypothetical protein
MSKPVERSEYKPRDPDCDKVIEPELFNDD